MSTVSKTIAGQLLNGAAAANADQLGEAHSGEAPTIETSTGWDAYDVWRRFIKEARERRNSDPSK